MRDEDGGPAATGQRWDHADQVAVFARAVEAGCVTVSGLGVGAGSATVLVNTPDWCGDAELARALFYNGFDDGIFALARAQVVRIR